MTRFLLALVMAVLYLLHQDVWFWHEARPLAFGFLPVGLAYHALYCIAISLLMWTLTRVAWPAELERSARDGTPGGPALAGASARSRRSAKRAGGRR